MNLLETLNLWSLIGIMLDGIVILVLVTKDFILKNSMHIRFRISNFVNFFDW